MRRFTRWCVTAVGLMACAALAAGAEGAAATAPSPAQPARPADHPVHPALPPDFFPYGAMHMSTISHWQHYLPPIDEWAAYMDADLARMKEAGLNALAAHVDWYDIEPADGQFRFERLDRLMDLVEKHGLKILPWPWPELQPEWVAKKYPEGKWRSVTDFQPGPACWDHPEVRARIDRFVRAVVGRYRDRPAVLAWDVGAEAGIWVSYATPVDRAPVADLYCYCPHTVARYRDWLKSKYGTIAALNEVWATYYRDFAEIEPVRVGAFERAQIFWQDWRQFMNWNTAEFQRVKAEAARAVDPVRPITCHLGGWGWAYVHNATDEYQIARHFDFVGMSFFPFWIERGSGVYEPSLGAIQLDGVRSASGGKPMWIEELQGGPSVFGLKYRSRFPTPADVRLWSWQSVAHGASGIFYWNWRPETTGIEAGGFGLVNTDGSLTDRARAAGQVARDLNRHARRLLGSRPAPARVAILHDPRSLIQCHGEHDVGLYVGSVRGVYRALYRANIPVDFLVPQQLMAADLSRYRAIYLPFAYLLSPAEGERLASYVEQGGHLFGGLWCAAKDERTFQYDTVPGAGLAAVFGVKERQYEPAGQASMTLVDGRGLVRSLPAGTKLPAWRTVQRIDLLDGGEVVAAFDDGGPALVARRHGRGRTLYAATILCQHYDGTGDANLQKLLVDVAASAGVEPPVGVAGAPPGAAIEARLLEGPAGRTVVVLNHGGADARVDLGVPGAARARVSDLLAGEPLDVRAEGSAGHVDLSLPALSVRVLAVDGG